MQRRDLNNTHAGLESAIAHAGARSAWIQLAHSAGGTANYAVVSLVGEVLTAVVARPSKSRKVDRNLRDEVPATGFDTLVVSAAVESLKRIHHRAPAMPIAALDKQLRAQNDDLALASAIWPELHRAGATHLIVLRNYRHAARLRWSLGHAGEGHLNGLGFYTENPERTLRRGDALDLGFFAVYAYLQASLVDLDAMQLVRAIPLMESRLWPALSLKNLPDPWSLLTPSSRIEDLRELVQQTVAGAIPRLVNPTFESATFV